MRIFPWAASLAAMWLFVFACSETSSPPTSTTGAGGSTGSTGSDSASTGVDPARALVDMFCTTVATPYCEAYLACCGDLSRYQSFPRVDDATAFLTCKEDWSEGTGHFGPICRRAIRPHIAAQLREGSTVFDQAQFDTCLNVLKSMTGGGAACAEPPFHVLLTTCISAFRGQLAPGEACPYEEDDFKYLWLDASTVCKEGRCEYGKCVPYLKPGDACDLSIDQGNQDGADYNVSAANICNFINKEVCWGDPGTGGAGGGGDAGGPSVMGTCRPQGELGDACNPNNYHECNSFQCDVAGKCVLPEPKTSACQAL
jgi:hypothetical protein